MKRTTLSLIAALAALVVFTGLTALSAPQPRRGTAQASGTVKHRPVARTTLTCPPPHASDLGKTWYTAYTPRGTDSQGFQGTEEGKAALLPAPANQDGDGGEEGDDQKSDRRNGEGSDEDTSGDGDGNREGPKSAPLLPLTTLGGSATVTTDDLKAPALIGTGEGALAPGYTVQQTTRIPVGAGRGLLGVSCVQPGAEFWFPGASTAKDRQDYVHLTNPDTTPTVVDLELFGRDGALETSGSDGITVPAHATVPVRLSSLTTRNNTDLTLRVVARSGRVGAAVEALGTRTGGDWLPPSAAPATTVVLPGLPKDTTSARLVVFAPDDDADLELRLATPTGSITPAGHETLRVKSGMTTAVDLGEITQGEAASLVLSPPRSTGAQPIVAGLRLVRGEGAEQEMAFLAATPAVDARASAAGSGVAGSSTTLYLTAPKEAATVRVSSSATSGGGAARTSIVEVDAGATLSLVPDKPSGKGGYAVTVERVSGGPVHAARMLGLTDRGVPLFTLQPMPDDRGTVAVPSAVEDLSVVN